MHAKTTKAKPSPLERTIMIGDAAIEVLAAKGSRGLTHRAVDQFLGWPEGTTSRYYRTRDALMTAVVQRLVDFEIARLAQWQEDAMVEAPLSIGKVVEILLNALMDGINGGSRQIARYELMLEARRRPAVGKALSEARATFHSIVESALDAAGFPDPPTQALGVIVLVDGICRDHLLDAEYSLDLAHVEGILHRWLEAEKHAGSDAYRL